MADTFKESSKVNWRPGVDRTPTNEEIQIGCLQRIADATEAMASNYLRLQADLDMHKRWYKNEQETSARLNRSNNALRGVITKLKKTKTK